MPAATLPACIKTAEDALQLARTIQWRPGEAFAMIALGLALGAHGDYRAALPLIEAAIGVGPRP